MNWNLNFGVALHLSEGDLYGDLSLHLPDGSGFQYTRTSTGEFEPISRAVDAQRSSLNLKRLRRLSPAPSRAHMESTEWEVTDENDTVWRLQSFPDNYLIARLTKVTERSGYAITFAYGPAGEMATATDSFGRQLAYSWNTRLVGDVTVAVSISRIDLPDGTSLRYVYDGGRDTVIDAGPVRLLSVGRYSAGDAELDRTTYVYGDQRFPYHVTEVRNSADALVRAVTYDGRGRAKTSSLADGVEQSTFDYGERAPVTTRTVTNALGKQSTFRFTERSGSPDHALYLTGVDGVESANCPSSAKSMTYTTAADGHLSGFLASTTDEEGRVTTFTRDDRGLPLTITRGSGTLNPISTSVTWHSNMRVPTKIVEPGLTTDLVWTSGNVTAVTQTDTTSHTVPYATNGQTRSWSFGYSGSLLTSVDGPLPGASDTTTYGYGADGYLRTVTNPVGHVTAVTAVNSLGQPISITDPNGVVTEMAYDDMGHVTSVTNDEDGTPATTSFTYDANWNVASIARPGGAILTLTWDDASRLTRIENADGESIVYALDKLGGAKKIEVRRGATITAERNQAFDELGRIIKTIKGDASAQWSFGYDKTDNLVRVTDPRSKNWTSGFDALNRLISNTDPEPATTSVARNGIDDITSYKDPRNLTTSYVRNGFGDIIRETSPDSGVTDYEYDARGLLTKKTRATGQVETFIYDAAGRTTRHAYAGSTVFDIDYAWDATAGGNKGKGRITKVDDQAGSSSFTYDARGNVLSETRVNTGSPGSTTHVTQYAYDLADRLTGITYPSGRIVTYVRDAMGRVTSVTTKASAGAASVTLASNITWMPMAGMREALDRASAAQNVPTPPSFDLSASTSLSRVLPMLLAPDAMARNAMPVTDGTGMNAGTAAQNAPLPGAEALTTDLLASLTYGNGLIYSKEYDQDNRLKRWSVEQGGTSIIRRKSISADGMNVTRLEDELAAAQTQVLTYSASARLASASGAYGTRAWTYDKVGNRTGETKNGTASAAAAQRVGPASTRDHVRELIALKSVGASSAAFGKSIARGCGAGRRSTAS